ncbi:MAG: bifunctional phosphopantothenoylcysteine decarboxylase/phosphopantothenate--cysteine ligase CoaBC [Proteobacteria bacterium]|nr:bifunctional phosphopantothenoylcysteine decarboxylase/phosphopantothenate--cysteine ligase CoaBC [Pseudomonadota bacterium]
MVSGKRILLIVTGGIAAYKSLDLVRRLRQGGASVRAILTKGGAEFITPLSLAAISGEKVYGDLFSLTEESEMGHIRLSRQADLVVVAPATADFIAKMAMGLADDLASTALLATDKDVLIAPAMNEKMWQHPATRQNMAVLEGRGVLSVGPGAGDLACGEEGWGRMAEVPEIIEAIDAYFRTGAPLSGRRALVTSGPTIEAIDPVRFISNRSSGKQGHAIAQALARLGAETTLIAGPVSEPDPAGVDVVHIETAAELLSACEEALPVDVAVCAAAVSDWRVKNPATRKIKKSAPGQKGGKKGVKPPVIALEENPDILARLSAPGNMRPALVIGFAAETEDCVENAKAKLVAKGCDWIVANDVSAETGILGGDDNTVHLIIGSDVESWPKMSKQAVAERLATRIRDHLTGPP